MCTVLYAGRLWSNNIVYSSRRRQLGCCYGNLLCDILHTMSKEHQRLQLFNQLTLAWVIKFITTVWNWLANMAIDPSDFFALSDIFVE